MRRWAARALGAMMLVCGLYGGGSQAATVLQLEGDPGDTLVGATSVTYTDGSGATIAVDVSASSTVTVNLTYPALNYKLQLSFTPRPGVPLVGSAQVMPLNPRGTE